MSVQLVSAQPLQRGTFSWDLNDGGGRAVACIHSLSFQHLAISPSKSLLQSSIMFGRPALTPKELTLPVLFAAQVLRDLSISSWPRQGAKRVATGTAWTTSR